MTVHTGGYRMVPRFARGRPSITGFSPRMGAFDRYVGGMGDIFSDLAGDVNSVADALGSAVMSIPGVAPLVNGPLKDFANSSVGQIVLPIIANSLGGGVFALTRFGPAMMTVWAMPGVARGDDFDHAMILATVDRLKQTAQALGVDVSAEIMSELQTVMGDLVTAYGPDFSSLPDIQTIADTYHVREDVAAIARAQLEHIQLPDLTDFDMSSGKWLLDQSPGARELRAGANDALVRLIAASTTNYLDKTSIKNPVLDTGLMALAEQGMTAAPKPTAVSMTAPKAAAPAAGMSTGEKIAIVAAGGGLLAILAAVLIK